MNSGLPIKLLGIAKLHVSMPLRHECIRPGAGGSPIAQVNGVYNAIHLIGDAVGDVVLYGKGPVRSHSQRRGGDIIDLAREKLCRRVADGFRDPHSNGNHVSLLPSDRWTTLKAGIICGAWSKINLAFYHPYREFLDGMDQHLVCPAKRAQGRTNGAVGHLDTSLRGAGGSIGPQEINALPMVSEPTTLLRMEGWNNT